MSEGEPLKQPVEMDSSSGGTVSRTTKGSIPAGLGLALTFTTYPTSRPATATPDGVIAIEKSMDWEKATEGALMAPRSTAIRIALTAVPPVTGLRVYRCQR